MTNQGMFNWILFNSLVLYLPVAAVIVWRKPNAWLPLMALFLGIIVGWLDMKSTEPTVSALLLVTLGFFCGFAQPKRAWLVGILLGAGVPVFIFLAATLRLTQLTMVEQITSLVALVFSFGGAYAGVIVRRVSHNQTTRVFEMP
ncbi:MAG: hypothetical protein HY741_24695 [Chloroflexi bacterium]|nr:hypothetical protein [Chloroflexota bacterium]